MRSQILYAKGRIVSLSGEELALAILIVAGHNTFSQTSTATIVPAISNPTRKEIGRRYR